MDATSDPQFPAKDEVMIRNTSFKKLSSIDTSPLLKIRCSGGLIQVQQRAIASICPYFEILSLGDKVILEMTNIQYDDIKAIKDLSLNGQCVVKRQNLKSLEKAAERLGMTKLRDIVSRIIAAESVPVFTVKIWDYKEKLPAENIQTTNNYHRIKVESDIKDENPNSGNRNEDGDDDEEMNDQLSDEDEIVWCDSNEPLAGPSHGQNSNENQVSRSTVSSSQNSEGAEQWPTKENQSEMTPDRKRNLLGSSSLLTPEVQPRPQKEKILWSEAEAQALIDSYNENANLICSIQQRYDKIYGSFLAKGFKRTRRQVQDKLRRPQQRKRLQSIRNS